MTAFVMENFRWDGMYLMYVTGTGTELHERGFVARFKYGSKPWKGWAKFLIQNFTVEEYFARMATREGPLTILESKGYLQPHIKRWLKERGYPVTVAGKNQMVRDQTAATMARIAAERGVAA